MFNHFQKLFLFFSLYSALPIYAMETNDENNQPSYNQEANAELLDIINTIYEQGPIEENWKNIIKCLENGADPNLKGIDDAAILHLVCLKQKHDIETKKYLHYFLERGANPNICSNLGFPPLRMLLLPKLSKNPQNFDPEMLELLLKYNANPNLPFTFKVPNAQENYGVTPLDFAAMHGNENSVKILLKYGADINAKSSFYFTNGDCYNVTPLAQAMLFNENKIIEVLCKSYASLEDISDVNGETAFEFAVKELKKPEPIIKTLLANARFKLPKTEKKIDSAALELLLILKHQYKSLQIPEDLKFFILSLLPALQNFEEPDSILYKKLFHKNYKDPYLFARLEHHLENINQIVNQENKLGRNAFTLLKYNEETKKIFPQLDKDIEILLQSNQETSPDNLALQICNNYEDLLKEEQAQNTK